MNNGIFSPYNVKYDCTVYPIINLTADSDNLSLPKNYDIIRLTSSSVVTITGIAGIKDKIFTLFNVGSNDIRIANMSSFSVSANKILVSNNQDVILSSNESVVLFYDDSNKIWRTAGVIKSYNPTDFTFANVYDFTVTSSPSDATGSSGSWTWSLAYNSKFVEIITIGPGGGGGSGRRGSAGSVRGGGGGGGSGGISIHRFSTSLLSSFTATINVPSGGAGAASVSTNDTSGIIINVRGANNTYTLAPETISGSITSSFTIFGFGTDSTEVSSNSAGSISFYSVGSSLTQTEVNSFDNALRILLESIGRVNPS